MSTELRHVRNEPYSNRPRLLVACGLLALFTTVVVAVIWRPWLPAWQRSYEQAVSLTDSNPKLAERLLRQSISEAGGRFGDAQLALCRLRGRQSQWKEAAAILAEVNLKECQSQSLDLLGREAYATQQWSVAQPPLAELLTRESSEKRELLVLLKEVYGQLGQFGEMRECVLQLTRLNPDDPKIWWAFAQTSEQMGLTDDAMSAYRNVLKHDIPSDASIHVFQKLIDLLVDSGDVKEARSELSRLIATHGRQLDCSVTEAELFRLEGQSDEALKSIERYFGDGGKSPRAHMLRGMLRLESGETEQALKDFEFVAQRDPNFETAHFKLAETYRRLGRIELARKHQAEYERLQGIKFDAAESKKRQREHLPKLQNNPDPPSEKHSN